MADDQTPIGQLLELIDRARRAVPATKYALAVAAVAAAGALITLVLGQGKAAAITIGGVFVAMILMFAFARLTAARSLAVSLAGITLLWTVILFFCGVVLLTATALVAGWPPPYSKFLGLSGNGPVAPPGPPSCTLATFLQAGAQAMNCTRVEDSGGGCHCMACDLLSAAPYTAVTDGGSNPWKLDAFCGGMPPGAKVLTDFVGKISTPGKPLNTLWVFYAKDQLQPPLDNISADSIEYSRTFEETVPENGIYKATLQVNRCSTFTPGGTCTISITSRNALSTVRVTPDLAK